MAERMGPGAYTPAIIGAVLLHVLVGLLLLVELPSDPIERTPTPKHIVANVVQEENRAVAARREQQEAERRRQQRLEQQRREAAARAERERTAAERKRQQQAAKEKAEQQARAEREQAAQREAARKQAAQEKAAKEAERKRIAEAERRAREAELQKQLQQELEQQAAEQAERELRERQAAEQREAEQREAVTSYTAQLREKIQRSWQYPPGVDPEQEVTVRINLVPTGEVIAVTVTESSGNAALDRSVEQAVFKASPLPVPQDIQVFERNFRTFAIHFRPENATW